MPDILQNGRLWTKEPFAHVNHHELAVMAVGCRMLFGNAGKITPVFPQERDADRITTR